MAVRPKTLPAASTPVIVGAAIAFYEGHGNWGPTLAALAAALLLQIGANLANDYFDYFKGADAHERLGPVRVTQAGLVTLTEMRVAMLIVFGLAALIGVYLAWAGGWPVVIVGLASILAALAYTGGPYPLGYHGLGDLFAFIFFGPVAVCGTVYVQAQAVSALAVGVSIPIGVLVVAILVINNLRDIETDRLVGKRTLAVRLGERGARVEYVVMVAAAYLVGTLLVVLGIAPAWTLLCWGSAPLALNLVRFMYNVSGKALNLALAETGRLVLVYGVLFAVGLLLARVIP
jgi:1,4-dihydroxy-2-naphthoate polyprenyltransferase